jgi:hypothetical protein
VDGKDAKLKVRDLIKMQGLKVAFNINVNYNEIEIGPFVTINGKKASFEETIPDRADIKIRAPNLEDVLEMEFGQNELEKISVVINNTVQYFDRINYTFKLNGNSVDRDKLSQHPVNDNDIILIDKSKFDYRIENILSKPEEGKKISVLLNGNEIVFDGSMPQITLNGKRASLSDKIDDGDNIKLKMGDDADPILSDLFEFMDIKKEELVGKRMRLLVNNVPARFTTPLRDGNNVTIEFAEV